MNVERIKMLQNLITEFETLEKDREKLIPTNPFEERLLVIIKEMDEANIGIIEIIKEEIKKEIRNICQELRLLTGKGLMDCKVALINSNYNIEEAKVYLNRKRNNILY